MGRKRVCYLILQKGSPLKFETKIRRDATLRSSARSLTPSTSLATRRGNDRRKSVLFPASTKSMSDGVREGERGGQSEHGSISPENESPRYSYGGTVRVKFFQPEPSRDKSNILDGRAGSRRARLENGGGETDSPSLPRPRAPSHNTWAVPMQVRNMYSINRMSA